MQLERQENLAINIIIADDHCLFRDGLVSIIREFEGIEVIGQAGDGRELIQLVKKKEPDVVLLDIEMPNLNGRETTEYLRKNYPNVKIIILTVHEEERFILSLMKLGINSYLTKNAESEEMETAIRCVMEEGNYFNESVVKVLHRGFLKKENHRDSLLAHFSDRELEVMQLICEEKTNIEIGEELKLSPKTVSNHRQRLMVKTESKNTVGIVLYALRNGHVEL